MERFYCTRKGMDQLGARKQAIALKLKETQKNKGDAASRGSTHDNAEFEELVRQESTLSSRLGEISEVMRRVVVIEAIPPDCEKLRIGHLADLSIDGEPKTVLIAGYEESDTTSEPQAVSYLAPLVNRFIGKPVDTEANINIGGRFRRVVLEGIRKPEVEREPNLGS